jgi:hypothetical protein
MIRHPDNKIPLEKTIFLQKKKSKKIKKVNFVFFLFLLEEEEEEEMTTAELTSFPAQILIDELKNEETQLRLNAVRRLGTIAKVNQPTRAKRKRKRKKERKKKRFFVVGKRKMIFL